MALGKDFRLPLDARPVRYAVHLAPDLEAGTFEGRMELEVRLDKPRSELILHAVELTVERARLREGGRTIRVGRIEPEEVRWGRRWHRRRWGWRRRHWGWRRPHWGWGHRRWHRRHWW